MNEEEMVKLLDEKYKGLEDELKTLREQGASKEELEKCTKALEEQSDVIQEFMSDQEEKRITSMEDKFTAWLTENREEIKRISKSGNGVIEFNPFADSIKADKESQNKAVGDVSTASGSDIGTPPHVLHAQLGSFNLRNDNDLLSLCTTTNTNSAALTYTEMLPKDGSYAFVGEGLEKPQIDFEWETRFETPKKIAAYEILTEEAMTDFARMDSVAREYLRKQHDLYKVNSVYFGLGTGVTATGATVYGRTFVAGDMADELTNGTANIMDVINACITDIYVTTNFTNEEHYKANVAMISPVDYFLNFVAAKDGNGLPLYPSASLFNQVQIGGITIRPWTKIPAGKIFVADMSKYNIVNYIPFSIRIGWINDQFIENKFTMLGESRFYAFVKNLDQNAFIYDDIATVVVAIEADAA